MRSWMPVIATLMLSGALAAQVPNPGAPTSTPPQTTQQTNGSGNNGGYIVSPPSISYGDGITPTVVSNQDTVQVTVPQNTSISGPQVPASNPATVTNNYVAGANGNAAANQQQQAGQEPFDFIVAPNGDNSALGGSMSDSTVSLGEVARKYRHGREISKRTITNADVDALNAQYPGPNGVQQSPDNGANTNDMAGTAVASPSGRRSPFSAPAPANSGGTTGAAQSAAPEQTPAYAQPSQPQQEQQQNVAPQGVRREKPNAQQGVNGSTQPDEAAPASSEPSQPAPNANSQQQPKQLPRSSSALPLLGTLGALSTLAGILYFKMR